VFLVWSYLSSRLVEAAYLSCIIEPAAVIVLSVAAQLLPGSRAVCTAVGRWSGSGWLFKIHVSFFINSKVGWCCRHCQSVSGAHQVGQMWAHVGPPVCGLGSVRHGDTM
jgi:hypothetical protein